MPTILMLKGDKPNDQSECYKTYAGLSEIGSDTYVLANYRDLVFEISDQKYEAYYVDNGECRNLDNFDLVYIRDYHGYEPERNCVAHYLAHRKRRFLNSDVAQFQHISKLTQYAQFSVNNVPIPRSVYGHISNVESLVKRHFTFPVIIKSILAKSGEDNYLVRTAADLQALTKQLTGKYIIQEFVPNERDYRYIVLGNTVACVYSRERTGKDEHRNNVSQGGNKTYLDLKTIPDAYKRLAVKAAQVVGREICGVDLMVNSKTNQPIILEANFNFGIKATPGVISDELHGLAAYLHQQASS